MDPVCVVSGQCACADRLVILYPRWSVIKAKFFDRTLLPKDGTVYCASRLHFRSNKDQKQFRINYPQKLVYR